MIEVDIEKRLSIYNGGRLLKFSAQLPLHKVTKIVGPSGAGKTTLLKIIAGLITPERGRISINEAVWLDTDRKINLSPQKRLAGFVFQDYALFPNMTVLQHLRYATQDEEWINRLLKIAELTAFANHRPMYLSGGQQQRLAVVRALAIKPRLILMDEPFSALDGKTKSRFLPSINELFAEMKTTAVIVSHYPQELDIFNGTEIGLGE